MAVYSFKSSLSLPKWVMTNRHSLSLFKWDTSVLTYCQQTDIKVLYALLYSGEILSYEIFLPPFFPEGLQSLVRCQHSTLRNENDISFKCTNTAIFYFNNIFKLHQTKKSCFEKSLSAILFCRKKYFELYCVSQYRSDKNHMTTSKTW